MSKKINSSDPVVGKYITTCLVNQIKLNLDYLMEVSSISVDYANAIFEVAEKRNQNKEQKIYNAEEKDIMGLLIGCAYYLGYKYINYDFENPELDDAGMPIIPIDNAMELFQEAEKDYNWLVDTHHMLSGFLDEANKEAKKK